MRKQEIPLKKFKVLFVYYLSRAVSQRHIAYYTHPGPVGYHGNGSTWRALQRVKEEEEMEKGKRVTGRASIHNDNRKWELKNLLEGMNPEFYRQNTWHIKIYWIYTSDIDNKRNHINC